MKRIFLTVGTTRFDKLCKTIFSPESMELFKRLGYCELVAQIGNDGSDYSGFSYEGFKVTVYRFKDSISQDIESADLVISHAGAGTCLEVLDRRKRLLVVVNADLMDNHQTEIAERLSEDGYLRHCTCETFHAVLCDTDTANIKEYPKANSAPLFEYLDKVFSLK